MIAEHDEQRAIGQRLCVLRQHRRDRIGDRIEPFWDGRARVAQSGFDDVELQQITRAGLQSP